MIYIPKIQTICDTDKLRPVMNHVYITKSNIVASNSNVLIEHDAKDLLADSFLKDMPETGIYIHREDFAHIGGAICNLEFKEGSDVIKITYPKKRPVLIEFKTDLKFPNYKAIMPTGITVPITDIKISHNHLHNLANTFGKKVDRIDLSFYGKNKAIKVTCADSPNARGLLMPYGKR